MAASGGAATVQMAKAIVNGFGDRAPLVMKELGKDPNSFAHAAGLDNIQLQIDAAKGREYMTNPDLQKRRRSRGSMRRAHWLSRRRTPGFVTSTAALWRDGQYAEWCGGDHERCLPVPRRHEWLRATLGQLAATCPPVSPRPRCVRQDVQEFAGAKYIGDYRYGGVSDYPVPGTWWGKTRTLVPANVRSDKFSQAIGLIKDEDLRVMDNPDRLAG